MGLRVPAARPRPRPHRPRAERAFEHFPAIGNGGHQEVRQRPVHVQPRRQPAGRPDQGSRGMLGGVRRDGRAVAGRRRRPVARQLDGRRRPRRRHLGHGRRPLRRLGHLAYTNAKVRENYSRRFRITFPNEELPAARPLHTTPIYDRLTEHNAVWGAGFGLEHPLWFQRARQGADRGRHVPSLERVRPSSPRSAAPCASGSASRSARTSPSTRCRATARPSGCRACSPTRCPRSGASPDRDAQPAGPHRRRVLGRPHRRRRVLPVRFAGRRGAPLALVPRPPAGRRARSGSRCSPCRWSA